MKFSSQLFKMLALAGLAIAAEQSDELESLIDDKNGSDNKYNLGKCQDVDLKSDGTNFSLKFTSGTDGSGASALCYKLGLDSCDPMVQFVAQTVFYGWSMAYAKQPDSPSDLPASEVSNIDAETGMDTKYTVLDDGKGVDAQFILGPLMVLPDTNAMLDNINTQEDLENYLDELKDGEVDGYGIPVNYMSYAWPENSTEVQVAVMAEDTRQGVMLTCRPRTKNTIIKDYSDVGYSDSQDGAVDFTKELAKATTEFGKLWVKGAHDHDLSKMYGEFEFGGYAVDVSVELFNDGFNTKKASFSCQKGTAKELDEDEKNAAFNTRTSVMAVLFACLFALSY